MGLLDKAAILAADDLGTEDVPVPEWGGTVRVRGLTGTERDRFEMRMAASRKSGSTLPEVEFRADLAARCIVGEAGERLFTDGEVAQLGRKSSAALDRIFDVIVRLSGLKDGAVEDAAEVFDSAPSGGSPSG